MKQPFNSNLNYSPPPNPNESHSLLTLDFNDIPQLISKTSQTKLDYPLFINCAGIALPQLLLKQSFTNIDSLINVNLHAPLILTKQIIRQTLLLTQPKHMIFLSSSLATKAITGSQIYSATKAGIEAFSKSMAIELQNKNYRFNCVSPGLVDTSMGQSSRSLLNTQLVPHFISTTEIAEFVWFLIKSKSINGQSLRIDNGFSIN